MKQPIVCWWLRRDLRLTDNAALYHALQSGMPVLPVFIFDRDILDKLEKPTDARVQFIHEQLNLLKAKLELLGSTMLVKYGNPINCWTEILNQFEVKSIFTNRDYEPYAINRDKSIADLAASLGIRFHDYKDQVVFEKDEILKLDGTPYVVFTPFSKAWKARLENYPIPFYNTDNSLGHFYKTRPLAMPALAEMGFAKSTIGIPPMQVSQGLLKKYGDTRDFPAIAGTSKLGIHYRFGTVSPRQKTEAARHISEKYFNEMIWREFYQYILAHFPHVAERSFRAEYDRIEWSNNQEQFEKWCKGITGIPMVDAGMRELNATGYMHNRVRMIVASFLTKNLLINWRWGEAYFAAKLLDFELASNNGGWQWAAGCGVDAAPYFRVFNPEIQREKFDPDWKYVKKWVPEFGTPAYPKPIVDLKSSRELAISTYQKALRK